MFTRRIFWGTVLTFTGLTITFGVFRAVALLHAKTDPEYTWPARVGRAFLVSL